MSRRVFSVAVVTVVLATAGTAAERKPDGSQAWRVPGDVPEMMAACRDIPALYDFSRNGYLSIECGYQAILLGSRIPIAPAPPVTTIVSSAYVFRYSISRFSFTAFRRPRARAGACHCRISHFRQ